MNYLVLHSQWSLVCVQLLQAAEAKAFYGLAVNYKALEAVVRALTESSAITGAELRTLLEDNNIQHYPDAFTEGFAFDENGILQYPGAPGTEVSNTSHCLCSSINGALTVSALQSNRLAPTWTPEQAIASPEDCPRCMHAACYGCELLQMSMPLRRAEARSIPGFAMQNRWHHTGGCSWSFTSWYASTNPALANFRLPAGHCSPLERRENHGNLQATSAYMVGSAQASELWDAACRRCWNSWRLRHWDW